MIEPPPESSFYHEGRLNKNKGFNWGDRCRWCAGLLEQHSRKHRGTVTGPHMWRICQQCDMKATHNSSTIWNEFDAREPLA